MSAFNGFASLFADRKISIKLAIGFACVLAILAIVSGVSWLSFQSTADGFSNYTQRVAVVGIAREIDRGFLNMRRFVREFAFTGEQSNIDNTKKEHTALRELLTQGLSLVRKQERREKLEDISRLTASYLNDFDKVVEAVHEQAQLQQTRLDPLGREQRLNFDALIAAGNGGDSNVTALSNKALELFMLARLRANRFIGQHDAASGQEAEQTFDELAGTIQALDAAAKGAASVKALKEVQAGVASYRDTFHAIGALETRILGLVNGEMRDMGQQVQTDAEFIKTSGIADEQQEEKSVLSNLDQSSKLVLTLSTGGFLLGTTLSWLIGRNISGPVVRMCDAMRTLAGGDTSVGIPGVGRKDEIGEMANTAQVFKENMIETDRLRAEQEAQKQRTAEERRRTMLDLAARFESSTGGIVTSVTAQATELQATAQSMASIAEQTSRQSTAVSAASEEAMGNVNAVAVSTEQLSASVREILQQINQSTQLTKDTVAEAHAADQGMQALASAMDRIGEVVGLINGIAGQTNLLALNATIEAARAGDAGKGFAVVASEVKALANQTAKATQEISSQIASIQEATRASAQSIQSTVAGIGRVSEAVTTIASAVEEQGAATAEIARNVSEAARGSGEVSSNIAGVNLAAQNAGAAASEVLASASSLSQNGEALKSQVDGFLLELRAA